MTTAFCGWYGPHTGADAATVLDRMADALAVVPPAARQTAIASSFALATTGRAPLAGPDDDRLTLAICGQPRWTTTALQQQASRHGMHGALALAYRQHGCRLFDYLRGTYSLVVIDAPGDCVLLAADRMGIHPVYFANGDGDRLAFASTTVSLRECSSGGADLDPAAIHAYLYFHMVPSPLSVFRGQRKLLPGQYLFRQRGHTRLDFHWNPCFDDDSAASYAALASELRETLRTSVRRCRPDAHTGAFLSGGLDSSTVAGLLADSVQPARTFSIGFNAPGYDETPWARRAATHFATEQHEYYVTPEDVVEAVPRIARAYDEPFGNSSAVPAYYCARLAREHGVTTLLAGDGGDELFGGNARYAKQKVFDFYWRIPQSIRRGIVEPVVDRLPQDSPVTLLRKLRSYVSQARLPMPDRLETYNFLHRTALAEVLTPDLFAAIRPSAPVDLLRETYARARSEALVNRMLFLDWKFTLADNDLRKVTRMCELAGTAVCYPMLDDDLVDLSLRIPARWKVRGTELRYFYKRALRDFLPRDTITKSKHGFGLPFGAWMKDHRRLQELAYDSLARLSRRGYLRADYLSRLVNLHREEHAAYYGEFIWALMMLELWLDGHGVS
jgi:asparagine synthase (glutamine-hydrolysing)